MHFEHYNTEQSVVYYCCGASYGIENCIIIIIIKLKEKVKETSISQDLDNSIHTGCVFSLSILVLETPQIKMLKY